MSDREADVGSPKSLLVSRVDLYLEHLANDRISVPILVNLAHPSYPIMSK